MLLGILPQHVLEEAEVVLGDDCAAGKEGVRAQHVERVMPAPIGNHYLLTPELAPQLGDGGEDAARNFDRAGLRAQLVEFGEAEDGARGGTYAFEHFEKTEFLDDVVDSEAQHETIVERGQFFLVGQLVGGPEHRDERHAKALAPVVEQALVDDGQERVEDRRVGLENLVEERDVRLGQLVRGHAPVVVVLEAAQADRAENLLGRAELGQQPLEIVGALDPPAELVGQHRLGRAGRSDDEHVAARKERAERAVDQFGAFLEVLVEFLADAREVGCRVGHRYPTNS